MNCDLNMLMIHYTTGQFIVDWLMKAPLLMLIMGFYMITIESVSHVVMTGFGYNDNTKLTPKSFLLCSTVIPAITLLMQTFILATGLMAVMGMLDRQRQT